MLAASSRISGTVIPAMRATGLDVAFFHEVDQPSDRTRINTADVPVFSVASMGLDAAVAALRAWKPDVMYMHGLRDPDTFERLTAIAPSVTFIHTYLGTCVSGTKTHTRPYADSVRETVRPDVPRALFSAGLRRQEPGHDVAAVPAGAASARRCCANRMPSSRTARTCSSELASARRGRRRHSVCGCPCLRSIGFRLPARSCDILFAGRMDQLKGGMLLLDALPPIRQRLNRPLRVVFAGDGPDRQRWESRANAFTRRAADVSIVVRRMVRRSAPGGADARITAARRAQRVAGAIRIGRMAAARYGVPAAAFAVGGIPQWLHDGVNGHLARQLLRPLAGLADAVVRCLRDPRHYEELSRGARQMAATFTMERHLPELIGVFERSCMVGADQEWVAALLKANVFAGPVLELGTGYGGATCRAVVEAAGTRICRHGCGAGAGRRHRGKFRECRGHGRTGRRRTVRRGADSERARAHVRTHPRAGQRADAAETGWRARGADAGGLAPSQLSDRYVADPARFLSGVRKAQGHAAA